MASSSIPPSLQVIPADGDMIDAEISSITGGSHNDIDIDIDLSGTPYEINDDIDYMMDDTDAQQDLHQQHVQPQMANDDNMVDEIEDIGTTEEVMVDEITAPVDDASVGSLDSQNNPDAFFDEIDFDDDEQHTQNDTSGEPSTTENLADTTNQHEATEQPTSTDETPTSDHYGGDGPLAATTTEKNTGDNQRKDVDPTPISSSSRRSPERKSDQPVASPKNLTSSAKPVSSNTSKPDEVETVPQPDSNALSSVDPTHVAGYAPDSSNEHELDTSTQVTFDEHTAEDTYEGDAEDLRSAHYISTVVVDFNDEQFSLFPPLTGDPQLQQYESYYSLIDDTQLASKNINELFATLRITLGNSVTVDEELEFQVHDLGLYISEVCYCSRTAQMQELKVLQTCTECFNFSFEMICDLFHRLNYNDGELDAQPLFVSLIKKPRFSSRFLKLQEAADQGFGRSNIDFLQNSEEEWDTEQHEEGQYDEKESEVQATFEAPGESVPEDPIAVGEDSKDVNQTAEPQDPSDLDHDGESHAPEHETQGVTYSEEQDFNFEDHAWDGKPTQAYHSVSKRYHQAQLGSPVEVFEQAPAVETTTEDYLEEGDDLFDFGEVGHGDLEASSGSHTLGNDEADRSCQWSEILISDGFEWLTWESDSDDKSTVDKSQTGPSEVAHPYLADESFENKRRDSNRLNHVDTQSANFPDTEGTHFDSTANRHDDLGRDDEVTNNLDATEFNDESEVHDQQWDDFQADESWEIEDSGSNLDGHSGAANIQESDHQDDLGLPHDDDNYQTTNDPGRPEEVHKESVADDDDFLIDWSDNEEETKPSVTQKSAEPLSESTPRKRSYHDFDSDIEDPIQDHTPPKRTRLDIEQKPDSSKSTTQ
jgi:hypothetical protein